LPYFFAIFIDDIIINVVNLKSGCYVNRACLSIILHADDILLLAPSVESLQKLVTRLYVPLNLLHLTCLLTVIIQCVRELHGTRFNKHCANISVQDGSSLAAT